MSHIESCYLIMSRRENYISMMIWWQCTWTRNLFLWAAGFDASFCSLQMVDYILSVWFCILRFLRYTVHTIVAYTLNHVSVRVKCSHTVSIPPYCILSLELPTLPKKKCCSQQTSSTWWVSKFNRLKQSMHVQYRALKEIFCYKQTLLVLAPTLIQSVVQH